jgi:hypothetical protein
MKMSPEQLQAKLAVLSSRMQQADSSSEAAAGAGCCGKGSAHAARALQHRFPAQAGSRRAGVGAPRRGLCIRCSSSKPRCSAWL